MNEHLWLLFSIICFSLKCSSKVFFWLNSIEQNQRLQIESLRELENLHPNGFKMVWCVANFSINFITNLYVNMFCWWQLFSFYGTPSNEYMCTNNKINLEFDGIWFELQPLNHMTRTHKLNQKHQQWTNSFIKIFFFSAKLRRKSNAINAEKHITLRRFSSLDIRKLDL